MNNIFFSLFAFLREALFHTYKDNRRRESKLKKFILYLLIIGFCGSLWLNKHLIARTIELNEALTEYREKHNDLKSFKQESLNCSVELKITQEFLQKCTNGK